MDTVFLDDIRIAAARERRGDLEGALERYNIAFDVGPAELQDCIGLKIQQIQRKVVEQRKEQLGLFGTVRHLTTGKI